MLCGVEETKRVGEAMSLPLTVCIVDMYLLVVLLGFLLSVIQNEIFWQSCMSTVGWLSTCWGVLVCLTWLHKKDTAFLVQNWLSSLYSTFSLLSLLWLSFQAFFFHWLFCFVRLGMFREDVALSNLLSFTVPLWLWLYIQSVMPLGWW